MEPLAAEFVTVGVDEGETQFQACAFDREGGCEQETFPYSGKGIADALEWLKAKAAGHPERICVAFERPRGAVIQGFLEAGFQVFSINPKQLDRFRDRFTVAGSKDDRLDARVLGHSLRTDRWAFRRVQADAGWLVRVRELSRLEDDMKQEFVREANRLRAVLHEYHVELLRLLPSADEPWFWDLVATAPTPQAGAKLRLKQVHKLLGEHRIRRISPEQVLDRLRQPPLPVGPGVTEAASAHALVLVPRLHLIRQQLTRCQADIQKLLDELGSEDQPSETSEHRDVLILRSLPGAGRYVVATMLAEAWWPLELRDYRGLRARCGSAPVTEQSGRSRLVYMRHACNRRLRNALYYWAWNAARLDPRFAALYDAMRQRGLSHARALRGVADRLLKLAVLLLVKEQPYNRSLREIAA
jgi:transposase